MKIIKSIAELKGELNANKGSLGLVPTMGALHMGHQSLFKKAREDNDFLAISLFVNPSQFGPDEDFDEYPRNINKDLDILNSDNVDLVFMPDIQEMYPSGFLTNVVVDKLADVYEGLYRNGHFNGVSTVVTKLFNVFKPDRAYFGAKDAQQCAIIKRLNIDLNLGVDVVICPTIREDSGLALSSRNVYLNIDQMEAGLFISRGLFKSKELFDFGEKNIINLCKVTRNIIESNSLCRIDYLDIVNCETFDLQTNLDQNSIMIVAVRIGNIRLIDNIEIK